VIVSLLGQLTGAGADTAGAGAGVDTAGAGAALVAGAGGAAEAGELEAHEQRIRAIASTNVNTKFFFI
jgi:hypothetical protein